MSITGIFAVIYVDRLFIMIINYILFRLEGYPAEGYTCSYGKNIDILIRKFSGVS